MFEGALIWLPCTLAIYAGSIALFRWGQKSPLLNPTLLTICGVAVVLGLTGNSYRSYFEGVVILHYLLGTAVVALAVPLHRNLQRLEGRTLSMASARGESAGRIVEEGDGSKNDSKLQPSAGRRKDEPNNREGEAGTGIPARRTTRVTRRASPGSKRTAVPAGMLRRIPKALARSKRSARLASKK